MLPPLSGGFQFMDITKEVKMRYWRVYLFVVVVLGVSLASMSHIYRFMAQFVVFPFSVGSTIAIELAFVATAVVYTLRLIEEREAGNKEAGFKSFWGMLLRGDTKNPLEKARGLVWSSIPIFFILLYVINVFSSYDYYIGKVGEGGGIVSRLCNLFFISIPEQYFAILLAHIAGGILPFTAFVFGKAIAVAVADARGEQVRKERKYDEGYDEVEGNAEVKLVNAATALLARELLKEPVDRKEDKKEEVGKTAGEEVKEEVKEEVGGKDEVGDKEEEVKDTVENGGDVNPFVKE